MHGDDNDLKHSLDVIHCCFCPLYGIMDNSTPLTVHYWAFYVNYF